MRPPDLQGPHGKAWRRKLGPRSLVAGWYVHYRGALLDANGWYAVNSCRLGPDAARQYPAAEHELQVIPVKEPVLVDSSKWEMIDQPVLCAQVDRIGDAGTVAFIDAVVIACVKQGLNPRSSEAVSNLWLELEERARKRRERSIKVMEQQIVDEVKAKHDA